MLEGLRESQRDHACCFTAGVTAALQRFSESTLEYLANLDQAPDPTVRKDAFASDISGAYDILFHQWLQSREAKVRSVGGDWWPHLLATLSLPSLEVLPQTPGPSAIPQDLGRDLCPSAHAEPCAVGSPLQVLTALGCFAEAPPPPWGLHALGRCLAAPNSPQAHSLRLVGASALGPWWRIPCPCAPTTDRYPCPL